MAVWLCRTRSAGCAPGGRFNFTYGDKELHGQAGAAYDDVLRRITSLNGDACWENLACRRNLNVFLPAPNTTNGAGSGCNGTGTAGAAAASYPGYGTGSTAGASPRPCSSRVR